MLNFVPKGFNQCWNVTVLLIKKDKNVISKKHAGKIAEWSKIPKG